MLQDMPVVESAEIVDSSQMILVDSTITGVTVEEVNDFSEDAVIMSLTGDPDDKSQDSSPNMTRTVVVRDKVRK